MQVLPCTYPLASNVRLSPQYKEWQLRWGVESHPDRNNIYSQHKTIEKSTKNMPSDKNFKSRHAETLYKPNFVDVLEHELDDPVLWNEVRLPLTSIH